MTFALDYKESKSGLGYYIKKGMRAKISIGIMLLSMNFGAQYHQTINKVYDYVLNYNLKVEGNFFPDPRELNISFEKNIYGNREVYLNYSPGDAKQPLYQDLLPENKRILQGLENRLNDKNNFKFKEEEKGELIEGLYSLCKKYKK
jgi:hypothetical protein